MSAILVLVLGWFVGTASAQTFAPGSATFPSPTLGRHFLDQPIAQCVVATPVPGNPNAVLLTPCAWPPPAPPPQVTPPIAAPPPPAEPKSTEPKEPAVLRIEVVPVAPDKPAPKAAPKAAPKKKECPC